MKTYFYISDTQKQIHKFITSQIEAGKTFNEIGAQLYDMGYTLRQRVSARGYIEKSKSEIVNRATNTSAFVWLKRRRNGLADFELLAIY